ncbi:MAG: crotonase/enoyl-CoA hydratase family protein [Burkholderiales bacterium]|nr:crotonase/enoyl-CoA hydratase family protein [Burkholderiales bacterium]
MSATYNSDTRAIWLRLDPQPRPSFNPELLRDLGTYCRLVAETDARVDFRGEERPVEYAVLASATPGVFNLGGDLSLFMQLIEAGDREGLTRYGRACVDVLYRNYIGHGLPIQTISLVQGECLGGGFEAALSSDLIIAERSSRFGFPEILFNLFPGMGAYSFLERRVGRRQAENLISSGKILTADDMLHLGIVDAVVEDGTGETEVEALIRRNQRSRNGLTGIARTRRRVSGLDFQELMDVVCIWVDTALQLKPRDLKLMHRLVSRQNEIGIGESVH